MTRAEPNAVATVSLAVRVGSTLALLASISCLAQVKWCPGWSEFYEQMRDEVRKAGRQAPDRYSEEIKRRMKERYKLDWLTPLELNRGLNIDF